MPATVVIPGSKTTTSFTFAANPIATTTTVTIFASTETDSQSAKLTIKAPTVSSLAISPTSVTGGTATSGTVTIATAAPTGGLAVNLKSTAPSGVPTSVTVLAGATTAKFAIQTSAVAVSTSYSVTASVGTSTSSNTFKVIPPTLKSFGVSPNSVVGSVNAQGSVSLNGPAPKGGIKVTLKSSSKSATVPATALMTEGNSDVQFTVSTSPVTVTTSSKITASLGASSMTVSLGLQKIALSSFTISPTTVQGGASAVSTIQLNGLAPTGGFTVKLSSDKPFVTVQSTATVLAGHSFTYVTLSTMKVTEKGVATITLTNPDGTKSTATLTVGVLATGLAQTPWPRFQHDNTGSGVGVGSGAVGTVKWQYLTQGVVAL